MMPGQRMREVRAVRNAYAESTPDSGVVSTQRDWLRGDTIVAHFDSIPPTDTVSKPKIREIVANGNARSFYQMKSSRGPVDKPTVNYVRGRIIDILFENRKVATVTVTDKATGVLVEPATASTTPGQATPGQTTPRQTTPGTTTTPARPTGTPQTTTPPPAKPPATKPPVRP